MNSDLFKLNWTDVGKGVITAFLTSFLTGLYQALTAQAVIDVRQLLLAGATAGIGYLLKNFLSTSDGKFGGVI